MGKSLIKVLGVGVLSLGLLAACGDAEVKEVSGEKHKSAEKTEKKEEKKPSFYKLGHTVSIDGMEVTINKVSWGHTIQGVPAEKGKVLRIEAAATNKSQDNGFVDSTEFQVYAADGQKYEGYFGNDDANMSGGELKKGKSQTMILEFDVPESKFYEVYYEPSFSLKDNAEIKYKVTKEEIK
ncbi:DUF4352 domain-containing protein [Fictibacillus sp. B-59209]|uniref:DUF4352 domain-containing protein n=1 Tax=Fictibacillus sp. B-59209 TaxID=3024873 RepID=UPI002E212952|nr:DUF4352 domain-containing protein [Fictibacillus sp. B-59209]